MANKEVLLDQLNVEIDDVRLYSIEIPDGYVGSSFNAHVDNHIIVRSDELRNGMVVLLTRGRPSPDPIELGAPVSESQRQDIRTRSRWAIVTDLKTETSPVTFTALYGDGTLIPRRYERTVQWIVLKETPMKFYCPACGEVHENEKGEDQLPPWLDFIVDRIAKFVEEELLGEDKNDTEKWDEEAAEEKTTVFNFFQNNPATLNTNELKDMAEKAFLTYSGRDAEATRSIYEAMEAVKVTKRVDELDKNDLLDFGGQEYAVVSHSKNTFGNTVLRLHLVDTDPMIVPTFILPSDTEVEYRPALGFRK